MLLTSASYMGHRLDQDLLAFAVEFGREQANSRDVAPRPRQRSNKPFRNHVLAHADQRNGPGQFLQRMQGQFGTRDDRVGRRCDDRSRHRVDPIVRYAEPSRDDGQISAFDEAIAAKLVE
jgi:hypothetical protein